MPSTLAPAYIERLKAALDALPLDAYEAILKAFLDARARGACIFVMGNGGSAATASHLACDINKGVCCGAGPRFKVICLNDNIPTMLAYANDLSYQDVFAQQLANFITPADVVLGISGSGNSENVLRAAALAKESGALVIGLTGFGGGRLHALADIGLNVAINDMQIAEDVHLVVGHMLLRDLCAALGKPANC
jgi:D-sedoheptulose 7-phosphate isomerase